MGSEFIHNGFINGIIIDSESINTWIHIQVLNGLIHGFIHGFRMKSRKTVRVVCWDNSKREKPLGPNSA